VSLDLDDAIVEDSFNLDVENVCQFFFNYFAPRSKDCRNATFVALSFFFLVQSND